MPYRPDPAHLRLGPGYDDKVRAAAFPDHTLRWRNQRAAAEVGLDHLSAEAWEAHFAGFEPLPDNLPVPLALRYHGHQFRHYNPALGDGRGFLFAQLRDQGDRLLDLGTKGSGTTPWSRGGDGRLTLKGGVREILATELLEARGVPTSRSFSLFETGERLTRYDEPSPTRSSVLVRLSHSHYRFGTFQRLAFLGEHALAERLVQHVLATYYPDVAPGPDPAVTLMQQLVPRTADLAAAWMAAGFVHGVLNTDNMSLTAESFDYGPWRFLATFDPSFTAAYFDESGLYAYGRQPEAVLWNLHQLAAALAPIGDTEALHASLDAYLPAFGDALDRRVIRRLGVAPTDPDTDRERVTDLFTWLQHSQADFESPFYWGYGGRLSRDRLADAPAAFAHPTFDPVRAWLLDAAPADGVSIDHAYFRRGQPATMRIEEVEALWAPIAKADDWSAFHAMIGRLEEAREALA